MTRRPVSLDQLQYEVEERSVTLRIEQWAHLMSILEVAQGHPGRVDTYLIPDLEKQIVRQMLQPEAYS